MIKNINFDIENSKSIGRALRQRPAEKVLDFEVVADPTVSANVNIFRFERRIFNV